LLAGDASHVLHAMVDWLKEQGYEADTAAGCDAAIEAIDRKKYDLVLADTRLADGSVFDFLTHCRRHRSQTSVVMMLGRAALEASGDTIHAGAFVLLTKPPIERSCG